MNATLTRESAHKFSVRWMPRPDFVQVETILGADLDTAVANATALLAANGHRVVQIHPTANGNATLVTIEAAA